MTARAGGQDRPRGQSSIEELLVPPTSRSRILFSASPDYVTSASRELRQELGAGAQVERLGPDLGALSMPDSDLDVRQVATACQRRPLVFPRHLSVERARIPTAEATELDLVAEVAREVLDRAGSGEPGPGEPGPGEPGPGDEVALQTWVSGSSPTGYGSGVLRQHVAEHLERAGHPVARSGRPRVLSVCITPDGVVVGLAPAEASLTDWPGGRVRLARSDERVSRAEFKLEELLLTSALHFPARGEALDLGASPGGWTRVLRQHGLTVWAVDPAALDERVATDPGVHHVATTAGRFLRESSRQVDLVVNDMRMSALRSCDVMLDAARLLRPGGIAVVTLKLEGRRPVELVGRCIERLRTAYDVVVARQLQHNRHEITVVGRRRAPADGDV